MTDSAQPGRRTMLATLGAVALAPSAAAAAPAIGTKFCLEVGVDLDDGISAAMSAAFEANFKKLGRQIDRYVAAFGNSKEVRALRKELKALQGYLPDYFRGEESAKLRLRDVWNHPVKGPWLKAAVEGSASAKYKGIIAKVAASQQLTMYKRNAITQGYAKLDVSIPRELEAAGYKLGKVKIPVRSEATNYVAVSRKPGGSPTALVQAGAKIHVARFDPSAAWVKIQWANKKGQLRWGWIASEDVAMVTGIPAGNGQGSSTLP